jgi:hypothetical protein
MMQPYKFQIISKLLHYPHIYILLVLNLQNYFSQMKKGHLFMSNSI